MWTWRQLLRRTSYDETEVPAEMRAQRTLNRARIPEIASYVLQNPGDFVFSALTASVDARVKFEPYANETALGTLNIPDDARILINDGQHRRAAIAEALKENPNLSHETIPVVLFVDLGLERCQQMFADLNRYAIRPSRSIGILYDHRNEKAKLARLVVMESEVFCPIVETERSSLALRSRHLFTLSAFYNACADLVRDVSKGDLEADAALAREYWETVANHFPSWIMVRDGRMAAKEVRSGFIHSTGIALQALGLAGNTLIRTYPDKKWKSKLKPLEQIDWSRTNAKLWEGRAMIGGIISKVSANVILTANVLKKSLGLKLTIEEEKLEAALAARK